MTTFITVLDTILLACGVIAGIAYALKNLDWTKARSLEFWVKTAVWAAEQTITGPKTGEQKKDYVKKFLSDLNVDVSDPKVEVLIEAAVKTLTAPKE